MYKFISEHEIKKHNGKFVYFDGLQISYPSKEVLEMAGYKPLVVEDVPTYDESTQYAEHFYVDGENGITQKWIVKDIP